MDRAFPVPGNVGRDMHLVQGIVGREGYQLLSRIFQKG